MSDSRRTSRKSELRTAAVQYVREQTRRRRTWRVAVPAAIAGVALGTTVTYAVASSVDREQRSAVVDGYPTVEELDASKVRQSLVSELLRIVGDETDNPPAEIDGQPNGYASLIIVDRSTNQLDLYWKGDVPERIRQLIADHPQVDVRLLPAVYSLAELRTAVAAVARDLDDLLGESGSLAWVGPEKRGTGIRVGIKGDGSELTEDAARALVSRITPVPIVEMEINETGGVTLF